MGRRAGTADVVDRVMRPFHGMSLGWAREVSGLGLQAGSAASLRGHRPVLPLLALVVAVILADPASAQVSLRVLSPAGEPIPAVSVSVLGVGVLLEERVTDERGVVELATEDWSEVRRLSLSHLGFQTLILQADQIPSDGVVLLEPEAIGIEGLEVLGSALCPNLPDPAARALWQAVASRYATDTGVRAMSARFRRIGGRDVDLYGAADTDGAGILLGRSAGLFDSEGRRVASVEDQIERAGYAWSPFLIGGVGGVWEYPGLDFLDAYHFATPRFGAEHDFSVLRQSEAEAQIGFCPAGGNDRPTLRGVLTLRPGEAFLEVDFRFVTGEPDMGAGGRVVFLDHYQGSEARPHLMAARGLFYRHDGVEQPFPDLPRSYRRRVAVALGWFLHPDDRHPCKNGGEGFTVHGDPPADDEGAEFDACMASHLPSARR